MLLQATYLVVNHGIGALGRLRLHGLPEKVSRLPPCCRPRWPPKPSARTPYTWPATAPTRWTCRRTGITYTIFFSSVPPFCFYCKGMAFRHILHGKGKQKWISPTISGKKKAYARQVSCRSGHSTAPQGEKTTWSGCGTSTTGPRLLFALEATRTPHARALPRAYFFSVITV